jgi:hypothetical protein
MAQDRLAYLGGTMTDPQQHNAVTAILHYFAYDHLPPEQQRLSSRVHALAHEMAGQLSGPELTAGLRKLLEAKDCFVRASLSATGSAMWERGTDGS